MNPVAATVRLVSRLRHPVRPNRPSRFFGEFFGQTLLLIILACLMVAPAYARQAAPSSAAPDSQSQTIVNLEHLVGIPAVSGYEREETEYVRSRLSSLQPTTDNLGDVLVTVGRGEPRRLLVTPLDEPGFIVSGITDDGFLRLQRFPRIGLAPVFNELYSAQPMRIGTVSGKWIDGVVAGLSIHLQPVRVDAPKADDLDNMYVDIGATSAADVHKAGVDLLSPIAIHREISLLGYGKLGGASIGDKYGAAAVLDLLQRIDVSRIRGTVTFAFVTQQWAGGRGLQRILTEARFGEMVYIGRLVPGNALPGIEGVHRAPRREPGNGVLLGVAETNGIPPGLAVDLKQLADERHIPFVTDYSADIVHRSYAAPSELPKRTVHLGIPVDWHDTPAAIIDSRDLIHLENLLSAYLDGAAPPIPDTFMLQRSPGKGEGPHVMFTPADFLKQLVTTYAPSNHEESARKLIAAMLPPWAKPETDASGNLILRAGTSSGSSKSPSILFVAHMDEIGFEVKAIADNGRLDATTLGGMELSFYLGQPALVHTQGEDLPAVMELPNGWDDPGFHWPAGSERTFRVDVGARSRAEAEKLSIKVGDSITIPKAYRPLLGARANARSFDDRVGCAALLSAVAALGGPLKDRNITFVWSTGEELGLNGAYALAKRLSAEGHEPAYVFAVDTFVSSDSPLESKRFADAAIGKGFVVRAIDDSSITPRDIVDRVVKLARANQISVQYGVTGGGNDGSAFLQYGSVDVPLGWPLRYSHSPGEVIDLRDAEALGRIITLLAKSW